MARLPHLAALGPPSSTERLLFRQRMVYQWAGSYHRARLGIPARAIRFPGSARSRSYSSGARRPLPQRPARSPARFPGGDDAPRALIDEDLVRFPARFCDFELAPRVLRRGEIRQTSLYSESIRRAPRCPGRGAPGADSVDEAEDRLRCRRCEIGRVPQVRLALELKAGSPREQISLLSLRLFGLNRITGPPGQIEIRITHASAISCLLSLLYPRASAQYLKTRRIRSDVAAVAPPGWRRAHPSSGVRSADSRIAFSTIRCAEEQGAASYIASDIVGGDSIPALWPAVLERRCWQAHSLLARLNFGPPGAYGASCDSGAAPLLAEIFASASISATSIIPGRAPVRDSATPHASSPPRNGDARQTSPPYLLYLDGRPALVITA